MCDILYREGSETEMCCRVAGITLMSATPSKVPLNKVLTLTLYDPAARRCDPETFQTKPQCESLFF